MVEQFLVIKDRVYKTFVLSAPFLECRRHAVFVHRDGNQKSLCVLLRDSLVIQ